MNKIRVIQQYFPDQATIEQMKAIADKTRTELRSHEDPVYILTAVGNADANELLQVGRGLSLDFPGRSKLTVFVGLTGWMKTLFKGYTAISKSKNVVAENMVQARRMIEAEALKNGDDLFWLPPNEDGFDIAWMNETGLKQSEFTRSIPIWNYALFFVVVGLTTMALNLVI
jgi:hypothetical protein